MCNLDKQRGNDVHTYWRIDFFLGSVQLDNQRDNQTLHASGRSVCLIDIFLSAGQNDQHLDSETVFVLYRVMTLIWIMFGLSYLMMIFGFITAFLRSKKVEHIERKLANNIKHTQSKLWSTVTREVNYLRHILNEVYVMTLEVKFSFIITSKVIVINIDNDADILYYCSRCTKMRRSLSLPCAREVTAIRCCMTCRRMTVRSHQGSECGDGATTRRRWCHP